MSVYFITAREVGRVKIGCAYEPQRRLEHMQVCCPVELVLEASFKGAYREERELHARFAAHRVRGEWFTLTDEIEAEIRKTGLSSPGIINRTQKQRYETAIAETRKLRLVAKDLVA